MIAAAAMAGLLGSSIAGQSDPGKVPEDQMSGMGQAALATASGDLAGHDLPSFVSSLAAPGGQAETSIAVDSTGTHVVVGFNDTRGFARNPVSVSGVAYSDDGGLTWVDGGQLPSPGTDAIGSTRLPQIFGDPDIKYLGGCTFIYSSIMVKKFSAATAAQTLSLHRSTDCGHTWSGPFEITPATNPNGAVTAGGAPRDAADKELMSVDPETGRVIVSWSNFTPFAPGGVEISTTYSDDAAASANPTWSTRRVVANTNADGQGAVARFAGNGSGDAYIAWRRRVDFYSERIGFAVSQDNGATWNAPTNLTAPFGAMDQVLGNDRVNTFPTLAVDNSSGPHAGAVYVAHAYNNSRDGADIAVWRSTDGGATFSAVTPNSRPGADRAQWFPWLTVDNSSGRLFLTYYDQGIATSGDLTEATYTYSDDGGATWSKPVPLTARPFHAGYGNDTGQPNIGDYNQAIAQDDELFAVWSGNPRLVNFAEGQPTTQFNTPDVYLNRSLVFKKIAASKTEAAVRLGPPSFVDSGGNGFINAGEQMQLTLPLENYVTNPLSASVANGVNATLSSTTPGVTIVQQHRTYPNIPSGGSATNRGPFTFMTAATFVPGTPVELELSVHTSRGLAELPFTLSTGTPVATPLFSENFDGVAPGVLPAGWVAAHGAGNNTVPWRTSNTFCGTSNAAFHQNANDGGGNTRWERLISPAVVIPADAGYAILEFDVCYNTEEDPGFNIWAWDGFFLRLTDVTPGRTLRSVLAEAFAEGFTTGSMSHYPRHLPRSSDTRYFEDMSVWAGDSGGFRHVRMKLPGVAGSSIQLRFEYTQDSARTCQDLRPGATCGVAVDNVVLQSVVSQ
jgi:hypothetical protein